MTDMRDDAPRENVTYFDKLDDFAPKARELLEQAKIKEAKLHYSRATRQLERSIVQLENAKRNYEEAKKVYDAVLCGRQMVEPELDNNDYYVPPSEKSIALTLWMSNTKK